MDLIPGISQIKTLVQFATGDFEGGAKTQENFATKCPGVSQLTTAVMWAAGDWELGCEVQRNFGRGVLNATNAIPIVGHVKGVVHYICDDKDGGDAAMKAASHSSAVIGGGVGGFLVGGPVGAVAGGAMAGAAMDQVITVGEIVVHGEDAKPYGVMENFCKVMDKPTDAGNYIDLLGSIALDGTAGYAAGNGLGRKIEYTLEKKCLAKITGGEQAASLVVDAGESVLKIDSKFDIKDNKPHLQTHVEDLTTGKTHVGYNKQAREIVQGKDCMSRGVQTELQTRVPEANPPLVPDRYPKACAEQQAYDGAYKARPDAVPSDLRSATVKMEPKLGKAVTVPGCDNCKEYNPAMGNVVTDRIPANTPVPIRVRLGELTASTAVAVAAVAVAEAWDSSEEELR